MPILWFRPMMVCHRRQCNNYPKCLHNDLRNMFFFLVLLECHAQSSDGCWKFFSIHTYNHSHCRGKTCWSLDVSPWNGKCIESLHSYLILTTSMCPAMRRGAELHCPDHLSDTWIRQTSSRKLRNDICCVNHGQMLQVKVILNKLINQFVVTIHISIKVH